MAGGSLPRTGGTVPVAVSASGRVATQLKTKPAETLISEFSTLLSFMF